MTRRGAPWLVGAAVLVVAVLVVVGVVAVRRLGAAPASPSGFFVDPTSAAAQQVKTWREQGRSDDARRIEEIASQPQPEWLTEPTGRVGAAVDDFVTRATAAGARPLFVAYHVPDRDCGGYSGGGATDAADYGTWVREVAAALRGRPATIILEPDAVPHEVVACAGVDAGGREALLTDAVEVLKASGPVTVYLDAGNPGFAAEVGPLADALRASGVAKADGFSLNVANFYRTDHVLDFGYRISDALGGAHFVVDTGRNGNGRADGATIDGGPTWCNPPGRTLGRTPTTSTGKDRVDAYLWIKTVGASDGSCRPGEPPAGQWWPEYALSLVPG